MTTIYGPDPLVDRIGVRSEIEDKLAPQLELIDELLDYGVRALKRTFATGERQIEDVVVLLALFRQALVMLDSIALQLRHGAVYAAELPLRALVEASWALEWMFKTGKEESARRYFVSHLRRNRLATLGLTVGSPEHEQLVDLTRDQFPGFVPWEGKEEQIDGVIAATDRLLTKPEYAGINEAFDRFKKQKKLPYEPDWFRPPLAGEDTPNSIRQLAARLDRLAEYELLYSTFAATSHGSRFTVHVEFLDNQVVIEPIRSGEGFKSVLLLSVSIALRIYSLVLEEYRPGEMDVFRRDYVEKWRDRYMGMPDVKVEAKYVNF
jgi:hypothetical protein